MGARKTDPRWSDVKKRLRECEAPELLELVHDLFKLSAENQAFLAARLLGNTGHAFLLESYRRRIEQVFFKRNGWPQDRLQLAAGRKLIRDYQKATADLRGTIELMLDFVETGTQFTRTFGDIDAPFYSSLLSVVDEIDGLLSSEQGQELYEHFRQRLLELVEKATPIGWGYADEVQDTVTALESRHAKG